LPLVDPSVSRGKLARELELWGEHSAEYRAKGWLLLQADLDELIVDVAFLALVPIGGLLPVVFPAVRLRYDDYDLVPPSLSFIDVFTGRPMPPPVPQALLEPSPGQPMRNIFITNHEGKQFLCVRGTREYHEHSDHNGDLWLLYRKQGLGSLAVLCDRVASSMTGLLAGVQMQMQTTLAFAPAGVPLEQAEQTQRSFRAAWEQQLSQQEHALPSNNDG
jgi:hypothetical protein